MARTLCESQDLQDSSNLQISSRFAKYFSQLEIGCDSISSVNLLLTDKIKKKSLSLVYIKMKATIACMNATNEEMFSFKEYSVLMCFTL